MTNSRKSTLSVQYLTRIAILGALASILFLIEIPVVAFYKLDLSTLPVLLGAFSMGPLPGLAILLIKDLTGMLHSGTMYVGELADFIMSAAYVLPAVLVYRMRKCRKNALLGMVIGTLTMIVVAVLVNWKIMIPFYMGAFNMPMEAIVGMAQKALPFVDTEWKLLMFVTAPFNLLKGVVLSVVTYLIYKPLSPMLKVRK
ncbi:MAG: ECF transporter S component [Aristaeellaceae bacterium]